MRHLNYQHLLYFWTTMREGNLTAASRNLRLSPSTVSAQIKALEEQLGHPLFERSGRKLVPTERGRHVARMAEQIFALGDQLLESVDDPASSRGWLRVGVEAHLSRLMTADLLRRLQQATGSQRLVVGCGVPDQLLRDVGEGRIDIALTGVPVASAEVALHTSRVLDSAMSWVGVSELVVDRVRNFPQSLDGAPLLLPDRRSSLRTDIEDWLATVGARPAVVGEFSDSALMKAMAADGLGLTVVPTVILDRVVEQYGLEVLGTSRGIRQRVYAVTDGHRERLLTSLDRSP